MDGGVGPGVMGAEVVVATMQLQTVTRPGMAGQKASGINPVAPARSMLAHETGSWPEISTIVLALVGSIVLPGPQMEHCGKPGLGGMGAEACAAELVATGDYA